MVAVTVIRDTLDQTVPVLSTLQPVWHLERYSVCVCVCVCVYMYV